MQDWGTQDIGRLVFDSTAHCQIVSLGQLEEDGHNIVLHAVYLRIWDQCGRMVAKVQRATNRLYVITLDMDRPVCLAAQGDSSAWKWHARYGHLNFRGPKCLAMEEMVAGLPQIDHVDQVCDSCLTGKWRCLLFPSEAKYHASFKLEPVHGDLCGPVTPVTPARRRYFFLLVDDLSRFTRLVLLNTKDEATITFKTFQARVEAEAGGKLGMLRIDRGREFTMRNFLDHCIEHCVQCHLTAPYTPKQNRVVERRNHSAMGMARSMLKAMSMPGWLWGRL
jgi:transposase InsO family protein